MNKNNQRRAHRIRKERSTMIMAVGPVSVRVLCMVCVSFSCFVFRHGRVDGRVLRLLALDILAHPVKAFEEAFACGGTRRMHVPGPLAHCVQLKALCYLCWRHSYCNVKKSWSKSCTSSWEVENRSLRLRIPYLQEDPACWQRQGEGSPSFPYPR